MVTDSFSSALRYVTLHPVFARAFRFLAETDLDALPTGRNEIDGDRMFVIIDRKEGRGRDGARLEAHGRYIDIQYTIVGPDEIGWRPLTACTRIHKPFDPEQDFGLFTDAPETWIAVPPGSFAIYFPDDAHAPLGAPKGEAQGETSASAGACGSSSNSAWHLSRPGC